ncbi:DsbA family protein [Dactylosporangium sp. NPDC049742]|uniref:DsbA family protein n=1 Tax=Dactylosporangium sp. NPDC049742 TaxID=3154737 RepID=UPI00341DE2F6
MTTPLQSVSARLVVPVTERDHTLGPVDAPVTLVEYGDYQCPFCGSAHPIVRELLHRRQGTVRFAFRHFPLTNVHPLAEMAAEAAEAAGSKRRFWQMHDWLFEHQSQLDAMTILAGAEALGLDDEAVAGAIRSHQYLDKIRSDFVGGVHSGVNGTPTFFINGDRHDGGYSLAELEFAVDEAAADAER